MIAIWSRSGAELEVAADQAIEACGCDPVAAVRALIVANSMLEQELADVYAKASKGFLRGRRVPRKAAVAEPSRVFRRQDPE